MQTCLLKLLNWAWPWNSWFYSNISVFIIYFIQKGESQEPIPEELPRFEREQVAQAKKIMKPFVLRRLKKDVLKDLPMKTDVIKYCDMSPRQRLVYDSLITTYSKSAAEEKVRRF